MKKKMIKDYCHAKDCPESRMIEWDGKFIPAWYCFKHAYLYMKDLGMSKRKKKERGKE